ncbi:N-acetylmuramoyl-L-alanine amidase [Silvanigrella sp.]|uniref:N-acetylmuramoyl-L-alanine amidase n=1 Tax=Silvanigrella sp. TaxID=2024976 RepID=UPI0037CB0579
MFSIIPLFTVSCGKNSNKNNQESTKDFAVDLKYEIIDAPSKGLNDRISSLVFHYTALNQEKSLEVLKKGGVSAHWLIPESGNSIYKLVAEDKRSYHAGISSWKRRTDLNDTSVGVEIVGLGYKCKNNPLSDQCPKVEKIWYQFTNDQINMIVNLGKDIQQRYKIDPLCIVGHSDIAIGRKVDPGPYFPWKKLAENGVGAWVTEQDIEKQLNLIQANISGHISDLTIQTRLFELGYDNRNPNFTDKYIENELTNKIYPEFNSSNSTIKSWKKIPFARLDLLNILNNYGVNNTTTWFDTTLSNHAIDAFLMHFLPEDYLSNQKIDNKRILAAIQALLIKYPNRAKSSCGY